MKRETPVYLSPFVSDALLQELRLHNASIHFIDTTLEGFIDPKAIQKISLEKQSYLLYTNLDSIVPLVPTTHNASLSICDLTSKCQLNENQKKSIDYFVKHLSASNKHFLILKDTNILHHSLTFGIYLHPHLFCPKEEILEAFQAVQIEYTLLERPKVASFGAMECWKSFIGIKIPDNIHEAEKTSQHIIALFDTFAYRSCSF